MRIGPWAGRKYFLEKMSFRDLLIAYFTYYAIMIYLALAAVTAVLSIMWTESPWRSIIAVGAVLVIYPLVWYLLHRFVLHGTYLYKSPLTAQVWKRIHYDHHQDPNDLSVLFGALYTTLPTLVLVILPIGWAIGGLGGAMAGLATGLVTTCFYEFCHCIQHLPFKPRWAWLQRIKKLHVLHHYHSEKGNYGITNYGWDRLFGTFYAAAKSLPRSTTVNNLGYTDVEAERFPWVARLSAGSLPSITADAH